MSCGGSTAALDSPEASLAASQRAQIEFRSIRADWYGGTPKQRIELEPRLRAFLKDHPTDARARWVRIYLSWVLIQRGDLGPARELVAETKSGPAGSARDFAVIAEASIFLHQRKPKRALALLLPLEGKIIDDDERLLFAEQFTQAALDAGNYETALRAMVSWVRDAPAELSEPIEREVTARVQNVPSPPLSAALERLTVAARSGAERERAAEWFRELLFTTLTRRALHDGDSQLAGKLVGASPTATSPEVREQLLELAARGTLKPRIAGRALGLLLSTSTPETRRRSALVAAGMSRALKLTSSEQAGVKLLLRDDAEGTQAALSSLSGEGAAILVAGVDSKGAQAAEAYAREHEIVVLLLHSPDETAPNEYAFYLNAPHRTQKQALLRGLSERGLSEPVEIGSHGVPCDGSTPRGQPQFPTQEWKQRGVEALIFLDIEGACARKALRAAKAVGLSPTLAFGLDSAHLFFGFQAPRLAVKAGRFPEPRADSELRERDWYEALGTDAARLGAAALGDFPHSVVEDAKAVAKLHRRARDSLKSAETELQTSDRSGFGGGTVLERRLFTLYAPAE